MSCKCGLYWRQRLKKTFSLTFTYISSYLHRCCLILGCARCTCFIRPVARIGSGDPVRVLRLYTMITLDEVCSVYCWDICTTCRYQSMCYSTCVSGPTALSVCSRLCPTKNCAWLTLLWMCECVCPVLYCTMPFIATCVDAIGMVFWDRPVLVNRGKFWYL